MVTYIGKTNETKEQASEVINHMIQLGLVLQNKYNAIEFRKISERVDEYLHQENFDGAKTYLDSHL